MGFRFYKRIRTGSGTGLNVSKSGVTPSWRTRYGSINPKGFSIRTGIPGLSYRGGKKEMGTGLLAIAALAVYKLIRFIFAGITKKKF